MGLQTAVMNCSYNPKGMRYGQIAGNKGIDELIYRCFENISEEDELKFVRKFREQPDDSDQIMHTVRELVLGAYLGSNGFQVRHDYRVNSKTPDWCIVDEKSVPATIVELTNFHIDMATEEQIEEQRQARGRAAFWRDGNKDNVDRLYHRICRKAQVYRMLVEKLRIPYIVAVFGEFEAAIDFDEVWSCLDGELGVFGLYPEVSGVLYFEESWGRYAFNYAQNSNALHVMALPSSLFPPETT